MHKAPHRRRATSLPKGSRSRPGRRTAWRYAVEHSLDSTMRRRVRVARPRRQDSAQSKANGLCRLTRCMLSSCVIIVRLLLARLPAVGRLRGNAKCIRWIGSLLPVRNVASTMRTVPVSAGLVFSLAGAVPAILGKSHRPHLHAFGALPSTSHSPKGRKTYSETERHSRCACNLHRTFQHATCTMRYAPLSNRRTVQHATL